MDISVHHVADYFILKVDRKAGDNMTHLKLQKLLYYAQAWFLAMHDRELFHNPLEAWRHGPVCREIYDRFRQLSWHPIPVSMTLTDPGQLPEEVRDFLEEVWDVYGQFSATKLEELTHQETPWLTARAGAFPHHPSDSRITIEMMRDYYGERIKLRRRIQSRAG